jgi:hypothetical protein
VTAAKWNGLSKFKVQNAECRVQNENCLILFVVLRGEKKTIFATEDTEIHGRLVPKGQWEYCFEEHAFPCPYRAAL